MAEGRAEGVYREVAQCTALPRTLVMRQEVEELGPIVNLQEIVDNAVEATIGRSKPAIEITFELGDKAPQGRLSVEDNGRGMSRRALENYFCLSHTTSRVPSITRDAGVLPLGSFINARLNRYGRGCAAPTYFGNGLQVESYQASSDDSKCYMVDFDYEANLASNTFNQTVFEKNFTHIEDEGDGWTIVHMNRLLAKNLETLRDRAFWEDLASTLSQTYMLFIHGIPESLWEALPPELTRGCTRPAGGLDISLSATVNGHTLYDASLLTSRTDSDLGRVLAAFEGEAKLRRLLKPCVSCLRFVPAGSPGPAVAAAAAHRQQPPRGAGSARGGDAADDESDISTRGRDPICDITTAWLNFPHRCFRRTKPKSDRDRELFIFLFWSGKLMVNSTLANHFPEIHRAAVALAKRDQETQNHWHKLEDPGRLVALVFASPDAVAHQHKSELKGQAYEMFCQAGPPRPSYRPPSDASVPRLFTYDWGAAAGSVTAGTTPARTATQSTAGRPSAPGWREDNEVGLAAHQLLDAFRVWSCLDDDGALVGETWHGELEIPLTKEADLGKPWAFDPASRGMVDYSRKYRVGRTVTLEAGELLMQGDPAKLQRADAGGRGPKRMAGNALKAGLWFSQGSDAAKQHYVLARPWRPPWSPRAPLISFSCMEVAQACKSDSLAERLADQEQLETTWAAFLPHRLALVAGPDAPQAEYDTNHAFNSIRVEFVGGPLPDAAEGPSQTGARKRGRGQSSTKAAAAPPEYSASMTAAHFRDWQPTVALNVERRVDAAGGERWEPLVPPLVPAGGDKKAALEFRGFAELLREPGHYRLRFSVQEEGVFLLARSGGAPPSLEHRFQIVSSHPSRLHAYLVGGELPFVRLGQAMPDLAVELHDGRGARVALTPDIVARLGRRWSPKGTPGGPLTVTASVAQGKELALELRCRLEGAATQDNVVVAQDNLSFCVRGLSVKPRALTQGGRAGNDASQRKQGNVPSVTVRLSVSLQSTPSAPTVLTNSGNQLLFTLASGPPAKLGLESGNWFNHKSESDPLVLSKGADLDNPLVVRIEDAHGNPFCLPTTPAPTASMRPKLRLSCVPLPPASGDGAQQPAGRLPVMFRKQAASQAAGGRARREYAASEDFAPDASGNIATIPPQSVVATGLPGDRGKLKLALLPPRDSGRDGPLEELEAYVCVRKVTLGVETDDEQPGGQHPFVRELVLDGTVQKKVAAPLTWDDLNAVDVDDEDEDDADEDEDRRTLLETAFERRVEFTCAGPREVYLRPSGHALGKREVLDAFNAVAMAGTPVVYEQCFVLAAGQMCLDGLRLSLADDNDDVVDKALEANTRVFINNRPAFGATCLRFDEGRAVLGILAFQPEDFAGGRTVQVHVRDADTAGRRGTGHDAWCYGTFYVRQESCPASLRLAPVRCPLLENRKAVTPEGAAPQRAAVSSPGPSGRQQEHAVEGVLCAPGSAAASGSRRAGRQAAVQLLQLQPSRPGALVDGAQLLRDGFSLAHDSVATVKAGETLRVPIVLLDQRGCPMRLPDALADSLQAHTQATLEVSSEEARAGTRARAASSISHRCDVTWPEVESSGSGNDDDAELPVRWLEVRIVQATGAAELHIKYERPAHAAAGGPLLQPSHMHLALGLKVTHGPLAPAGYRLVATGPGGQPLDTEPLAAHPAAANGGGAGPHHHQQQQQPPACQKIWRVCVPERSQLELRVQLLDVQGSCLTDTGAFKLQHALRADLGWPAAGESPCRVQQGVLSLHLPIGAGEAWVGGPPKLLVFAPASSNFVHAEPFCVYVDIQRGRYPVEPLELAWLHTAGAPPPPRSHADVLQLPLTNAGADAHGWQPRLPVGFTVQVPCADGSKLGAAELRPLCLRYERKEANESGQVTWKHDASAPSHELQPQEGGVFQVAEGELPLPTRAGVDWRLVAIYTDPRIANEDNRLAPVVVAALRLSPAPPARIELDAAVKEALGREEARRRPEVVEAEALSTKPLPELRGKVTDGWGNACGSPGAVVALVAQPASAAGAAAGQGDAASLTLYECPLDESHGAFSIPACSLEGLPIDEDCELRLELLVQDDAGQRQRQPAAHVLIRTVYVSLHGDSGRLKQRVEELKAQVEAKEQEIAAARKARQLAISARDGAEERRAGLLRELGALGVAEAANDCGTSGDEAIMRAALQRVAARNAEWRRPLPLSEAGTRTLWGGGNANTLRLAPQFSLANDGRIAPDAVHHQQRLSLLAGVVSGVPDALGPLVMLGCVERQDAAQTLFALPGAYYDQVFVTSAAACSEVRRRLQNQARGSVADLSEARMVRNFDLKDGVEQHPHPQGLLPKLDLRRRFSQVLDMEPHRNGGASGHGFVGFAVNLVHLSPHLLEVRVPVPYRPNAPPTMATLRQTMLQYVFKDTLVFETAQHLNEFVQRCDTAHVSLDRVRCISVDGLGSWNVGARDAHQFGVAPTPKVWFSGLPQVEITPVGPDLASEGALDLRLRTQQVEQGRIQRDCGRLASLSNDLSSASHGVESGQQAVQRADAELAAAQQRLVPELQRLREQMRASEQQLEEVAQRERARVGGAAAQGAGAGAAGRARLGGLNIFGRRSGAAAAPPPLNPRGR